MAEGTQLTVQMEELNNSLKLVSTALVDLTVKLNEIQEAQRTLNGPEPLLTSGYVNWNSNHNVIKTEKWIKMSTFLEYCRKPAEEIFTDFNNLNEDDKHIVIDEKTRFPQDELYVNLNNPLVRAKVLYILAYRACEVDRILNIAEGEAHTYSSFEKEHGLKWVEPLSEATNAAAEIIQKPTAIIKTLNEPVDPAPKLWTSEELESNEPEAKSAKKDTEEGLLTQKLCKNIANILDKLTLDNFNSKIRAIKELLPKVKNQKLLQLVAKLLHEKVLEKPGSAEVFAKLAGKLAIIKVPSDDNPDKVISFRTFLINICQEHFDAVMEIANENDLVVDNNFHDKNMVKQMQAVANAKFIGELYNVGMLTDKIVDYCLKRLSNGTEDDKIECFCELLATVGKELDDSGNLDNKYIQKLYRIVNSKDNKLSDRVLFIVQDVIDLKERKWAASAPVLVKNLPKTIDEIQSDTHKRALLRQLMNDFGMRGNEQKEQTKVSSDGDRSSKLAGMNLYSVETLKLEASSQKIQNYIQDPPECFTGLDADTLDKFQADPTSRQDTVLLASDVTSNQRATMTTQLPLESDKEKKNNLKKKIRVIISEYILNQDINGLEFEVVQLMAKERAAFIMNEMIDFVLEKSIEDVGIVAKSLLHLVATDVIAPNDFLAGLKATLDDAPDILIDIPKLYKILGIIIAPVIANCSITFQQIFEMSMSVISAGQGNHLLLSLIENVYESKGFYFTRKLWLKSEMSASQWMIDEHWLEWPEIIRNVIGD